ncbi:hypothetical protein JCM11641_007947 [Rhodosporidiobolus odoratus]
MSIGLNGQEATALVDSGSQADVLSTSFAHRLGIPLRRLVAPLHADLSADGHSVRLGLYGEVEVQVGTLSPEKRSFFISPLPSGVDVILGVPWLGVSGVAVSANKVFIVPSGPSDDVIDFAQGRFALQPQANFDTLGFTTRPMTTDEQHRFVVCAITAGVEGLEDYVDFEPHNPLLDEEDNDPSLPDISAEEAEEAVQALLAKYADVLVSELPDRLPPHRPEEHSIELLDDEVKVKPRAISIPARYDQQWRAHVRKFVETGYWAPEALESACSMFAVPKHDRSQARFVINLKPRNANTCKRLSPIPHMKAIRFRVASRKYRSKLDFKNAYEQIRLALESVAKSGFITPSGTFVSRVMQQGDTNVPDTMHRVCSMMFSKVLGRFLDVFYDDVFVYSHTCRAHVHYLNIVFQTLRHYRFFLSRTKVDLLAPRLEALGSIIDDSGISIDPSKMDAIRAWPTPRNPKDILRFMGTAQWMADHLPHLNKLAAPLTCLTGKVDWEWTPACNLAFSMIKELIPQTLQPLDLAKLESGKERLFLFSDASIFGCGGWVGQGTCRQDARPFRYHSAKFNNAQRNYHTTDQELLGVLDLCLSFEDLLLGWDVNVVTDHLPLRTYWDRPPKLTRRHIRLWETVSQFSLFWEFIPGRENVFADSLSRLAELCVEEKWLNLPTAREPEPADDDDAPFPKEPSANMVLAMWSLTTASVDSTLTIAPVLPSSPPSSSTIVSSFSPSFLSALRSALPLDTLGSKIFLNPSAYPTFSIVDDLLFHSGTNSLQLYLPAGTLNDDAGSASFIEAVTADAHSAVGHLGGAKTLDYLRRAFWWPGMHKDVFDYVRSCEPCARSKPASSKPFGLLHPLDTPHRPWSAAGMDFMVGLPPVTMNGEAVDSILTVTDLLSKMVILIPLPSNSTAEDVASRYHDFVVRRFGIQDSLVSDRDPKFTSRFWRSLHSKLNTTLRFSSSAHPQTDGRSEVTNKIVSQMLRTICEDDPEGWASSLTTAELALNAASSSATGMSPFEIVYGFLPLAAFYVVEFSSLSRLRHLVLS